MPLSQRAVPLIWTALSLPKGYCLDIATTVSCFSFYTNAIRASNIVKVAFYWYNIVQTDLTVRLQAPAKKFGMD